MPNRTGIGTLHLESAVTSHFEAEIRTRTERRKMKNVNTNMKPKKQQLLVMLVARKPCYKKLYVTNSVHTIEYNKYNIIIITLNDI